MCEASAFIVSDENEELLLNEVAILKPAEGKIELITIMGEKKVIDAKIKEINLVKHKIILE